MSYKYNAITGQLDYFEDSEAAKLLIDTRICDENISALRLVTAIDSTDIELANNNIYSSSKVLGLSLQSGNIGDEIEVLLFGKVEDNSFSFTLNEPLFLTSNGQITSTAPTSDFSVNIGHSLGVGAIFIDIKEPIEI